MKLNESAKKEFSQRLIEIVNFKRMKAKKKNKLFGLFSLIFLNKLNIHFQLNQKNKLLKSASLQKERKIETTI